MGQTGTDFRPAHEGIGKFERAILNQFRVQSAVPAKVDILEKNSPHGRIDFGTGLPRMHREGKAVCLGYW